MSNKCFPNLRKVKFVSAWGSFPGDDEAYWEDLQSFTHQYGYLRESEDIITELFRAGNVELILEKGVFKDRVGPFMDMERRLDAERGRRKERALRSYDM